MCGRFAITLPKDAVAGLFDVAGVALPEQEPRYNVCPTQRVMSVHLADGERCLELMRWGFLPRWYKNPSDGPLIINARAETIADKPAFRTSCRDRRCLIPASGFFEWTKAADGGKDPWYIFPKEAELFAFAGIWRDWTSPEGAVWTTCAIVTCGANDALAGIHHRMPVIIDSGDYGLWLGEEGRGAARLMRPATGDDIGFSRVSREVNKARYDKAELIAPLPGINDV